MEIGFVGLGKLGYPVACAIAQKGHSVIGVDPVPPSWPAHEPPPGEVDPPVQTYDRTAALNWCDIVFVAVQTPHGKEFGGDIPLDRPPQDFDYSYLKTAIKQTVPHLNPTAILVVISTVLPGTMRNEVLPLIGDQPFVYNPFFIAMGSVVEDFLNPEFVLMGIKGDREPALKLIEFYRSLMPTTGARARIMSIESAELCKVAYNTFITQKICFANWMMEVSERVGANCDDISDALAAATDRIASGAYLRGGMGDGGACHPRDNIALSWLGDLTKVSWDLPGTMISVREEQARWMASLVVEKAEANELPICIAGYSYKRGLGLTEGSAALLTAAILRAPPLSRSVRVFDPYMDRLQDDSGPELSQYCYLIGCNHAEFAQPGYFPLGSVVVDPWGYIPRDQDGIIVKWVGRK